MNKLLTIVAISICYLIIFTVTGFSEEKISGESLRHLISGQTIAGTEKDGEKSFVKTFNPDGTWISTNPAKKRGTKEGEWRINTAGQLCSNGLDMPEKCSTVMKNGAMYSQIIGRKHKIFAEWKIETARSELYVTHYKKKALSVLPAAGHAK